MTRSPLLHHHARDRGRQLRWVLPLVALLVAAVLATAFVQFRMSDQAVSAEFFRAHKTISHTGELLREGSVAAAAVLVLAVLAVGLWALYLTRRIVAPVHALHCALDQLVAGDLGIRVELARGDEFQEVGESLNRLVEEFASTLGRVHTLADQIEAAAAAAAREAGDDSAERRLHALAAELDRTLDFFRLAPRRTIDARNPTSAAEATPSR